MQTKPSIVFVHGLWADGSCLQQSDRAASGGGYEVIASQHSLDSVRVTCHSQAYAWTRQQSRHPGRAFVRGDGHHGGGNRDRVAGLVYIAALAPDENETSQSQQNQFPRTDVFSYIEGRGRSRLAAAGRHRLFSREICPSRKQKLVWATHMVPVARPLRPEG